MRKNEDQDKVVIVISTVLPVVPEDIISRPCEMKPSLRFLRVYIPL